MRASRRPGAGLRRLTLILVLILVAPALTLVWLGATLLERDRAMLAERAAERRAASAEVVTRALVQSMSEAERWLGGDALPEGTVRLTRTATASSSAPSGRLIWTMSLPDRREAATAPFVDAERLEFRGNGDRGLSTYTALARSPDAAIRAGALLRAARVERRLGHAERALQAYRDLAHIRDIAIDRTPVDLIARRAICEMLQEERRHDDLAREASVFRRDLIHGRWTLDRPAWELAARDVERWTGPLDEVRDRRALTLAIERIDDSRDSLPSSGRRVIDVDDAPVTAIWRKTSDEFRVVVVAPAKVKAWLDIALGRELPASVDAALIGDSGALVAGTRSVTRFPSTTVAMADSGLPWTLVVGPRGGAAVDSELGRRRLLLVAGVAALGLLFIGSSYLLWRVVRRELAIARLQTDFVSAVSHEFRTPLTSLRHITELLQESDDMPAGRRQSLYGMLGQSAERLHRLVESVLDFARMEEGRRPWHLRRVDLTAIVSDLVESFRREHPAAAIELDAGPRGSIEIDADTEALSRAVWNLVDNAVKYSPDGGLVRVSMRDEADEVAVIVADSGLGIPREEQSEIFGRFVRGRAAAARGIAGTGLGLAMVSHIVEAHGGRVTVESQEGQGSTFTIALPKSPARASSVQAAGSAGVEARRAS